MLYLKELMLILVNLTSYLLIYVHRWFGFVSKIEFCCFSTQSGLAWKHSFDVGAGVINADYRGPIEFILFNHSSVDFEVKVGD
jgi:hypothetical protein